MTPKPAIELVTVDSPGENETWGTASAHVLTGSDLRIALTVSAMKVREELNLNTDLTILCSMCDENGELVRRPDRPKIANTTGEVMCGECLHVFPELRGINPFLWVRFSEPGVASDEKTRNRLELWLSYYFDLSPFDLVFFALDFWTELQTHIVGVETALLYSRPELLQVSNLSELPDFVQTISARQN